MKKTIYLHIGSGKTGTTSIQQMLADNVESLEKNHWLYYVNKNNISHSDVFNWRANMSEDIENFCVMLKNKLIESNYNNMIISSENMMGLCENDIKIIHKAFSDDDTDIKIIAYVRNQVEHMPTHFLQKQKDPFQLPGKKMKDFFDKYKNIYGAEHIMIMKNWEHVFGKDNIIIKIYDKKTLKEGNACIDFAKELGIDAHINKFDYFKNDSLISEVSNLISCIDETFPSLIDKSSEHFLFRQKQIINKLLLVSVCKKEANTMGCQSNLEDIKNILIEYFNLSELPENLTKIFEETENNVLSLDKYILLDDDLKQVILDYYKNSSNKFANEYLDEFESSVYLKYYGGN